jgi:hypothetical protein
MKTIVIILSETRAHELTFDNFKKNVIDELNDQYPRAFLIPIHPEQTYFPKITSNLMADGTMVSRPLHLMTPDLLEHEIIELLPYLNGTIEA